MARRPDFVECALSQARAPHVGERDHSHTSHTSDISHTSHTSHTSQVAEAPSQTSQTLVRHLFMALNPKH